MPRCKVGDLAIMLSSNYVENIGVVVEIVSSAEANEKGLYWKVKTCGRPIRLVDLDTHSEVFKVVVASPHKIYAAFRSWCRGCAMALFCSA